jgi:hypothetical protein
MKSDDTTSMSEKGVLFGADKIYFVKSPNHPVILIPVKTTVNYISKKFNISNKFFSSEKEIVLSENDMGAFNSSFSAYLNEMGYTQQQIKSLSAMNFENETYLNYTWHRRKIELDSKPSIGSTSLQTPDVRIYGDGSKRSFYGSNTVGKLIRTVTDLDDLRLEEFF